MMEKDVKEFLKRFELAPKVKNGDLVLVAEIMRVTDAEWGKRVRPVFNEDSNNEVGVVDVFPPCGACKRRKCRHEHIMDRNKVGGQFSIMKLKEGDYGKQD